MGPPPDGKTYRGDQVTWSKKWILDRGPCFEANCVRIWAKRVQKRGPPKAYVLGERVFGHLWMVNRNLDLA